jgi:outer membrane murein-binding lipoprotein Lpp
MHKIRLLILLVAASFLFGCNKQAKINSQKIDNLSQRIAQLEQNQVRQMQVLQAELNELAPELNKASSTYFEKNQDAALFFHTNTLYLLLTIGKQIETQLQLADSEHQAQSALDYTYHTNELGALYICTAQLSQSLIDQQKAIVDSINAETRHAIDESQDDLVTQIKTATAPDPAEAVWRQNMLDELAKLEGKVNIINARLQTSNPAGASH